MKYRIFFVPVFVSILTCTLAFAQNGTGSWNVANVKVNLDKKWLVFGELQLRSNGFYEQFYYTEYKTGVQYQLDKNFTLLLGLGNYDTYNPTGNFKSPMVNDETRIWQQLTMTQFLDRLIFEHRYRVEQRFVYAGYRNRFRYRLNCTVPLNNKKLSPKTLYVYAYNELFFTNKGSYFERNRVTAGAGYQFTKELTVQVGYINQFDYQPSGNRSKNFLQLNLLFDLFSTRRTGQPVMPAILD